MNARYEFRDGSSSKYWNVSVKGKALTTHWGRIGAKGQRKTVQYGSAAEAKAAAAKAAEKKVKKGYRKADDGKKAAPSARSKLLGRIEAEHDFRFLEEYRQAEAWFKSRRPADRIWAKPSTGAVDTAFDLKDAALVSAIQLQQELRDAKKRNGNLRFWHTAFVRHAYPVARTPGGDPIVQIAGGENRGALYLANHENWYGVRAVATLHEGALEEFLDEAEDTVEELGIESFENLDTDDWLALMAHENMDFMFRVADSLQDFYRYLEVPEPDDTDEEVGAHKGFEIGADECWARLCDAPLEPSSLDVLGWLLDRLENETILWVDRPWAELEYEELATDRPVGLTVFTQPVDVEGALTLSAEMLLGDESMRDERGFLFLDEVRCEALLTLADTVAVFAGGLVADKLACFSAPDATTHLGVKLETELVVSGQGAGSVELWPNTEWRVSLLDGAVGGVAEASAVLSFDAETIEDDSVNSVIANMAEGRLRVPKSFRFPGRPARRAARKAKKAKAAVRRVASGELWDFLEGQPASEESRNLLRGNRLFEQPESVALIAPDLSSARRAPGSERASVIVVTDPLSMKGTLQLRAPGGDDAWYAYWFCESVSCLDFSLDYNGLAVFAGGLNARIVSTARADCHLRVERHLECAVQCGSVYVADGTRVNVGAVTGWFSGRCNTSRLLPSLASEIEDEGSVWSVLLEHIDALPEFSS